MVSRDVSSRGRKRARRFARNLIDSARYHLQEPNWAQLISEDLAFGQEENALFESMLADCHQYLEYGTGSSTIFAARAGKRFAAVESDKRFLEKVKERCAQFAPSGVEPLAQFLHGNIGPNGPWGKPILPAVKRPKSWRRYPIAPWELIGPDFKADLILIDGRFRVACTLAVVLNQPETKWTVLLDDYADRPEYRPLEEFMVLERVYGRMAKFHPRARTDFKEVSRAFEVFTSDWR